MNPQVGDVWQYTRPGRDDNGLTVLLHEYIGPHPSHLSEGDELSYLGLDLLTGEYDEFVFNTLNMAHWRKLA